MGKIPKVLACTILIYTSPEMSQSKSNHPLSALRLVKFCKMWYSFVEVYEKDTAFNEC